MRDAVIVEAVRTPVAKGKASGGYAHIHPVDLHAHALRGLLARVPGLDPVEVDDVIGGVVTQVGEQSSNSTRLAALAAGLPESVPAVTVDRQCGSSQQALSFAAQGLVAGAYDVVVVSGAESMSRVPIGSNALQDGVRADVSGPSVTARYGGGLVPQGISAELIARKYAFSRTQLDEFAATSHRRAAETWQAGQFAAEVVPVPGADVTRDETIRPDTSVDRLAGLPVAFAAEHYAERFGAFDWKITAGNSSPLNDGSAALLLTTSETARRRGWRPRARVHTAVATGDDPVYMLTGIIPATAKVLSRAGLTIDDIDVFEVNEAFASVVLAWLAETGVDAAKVNVGGGCHRHRPSARSQRRPPGHHVAGRARTHRRTVRLADHVRGRRHSQRDHHRKARRLRLAHSRPRVGETIVEPG